GGGEDAEDGGDTHDEMEVGDDEKRVVQRDIEGGLGQEGAGQSAGGEERDEADSEQHGRIETDAAAPHGAQPVEGLDGGGDADGHGHEAEGEGGARVHAAHEHMVAPHHEAHDADTHDGIDHSAISEDGLAREGGEQLRGDTHAGQDGDVDLGMSEEPEQVLPQQR